MKIQTETDGRCFGAKQWRGDEDEQERGGKGGRLTGPMWAAQAAESFVK